MAKEDAANAVPDVQKSGGQSQDAAKTGGDSSGKGKDAADVSDKAGSSSNKKQNNNGKKNDEITNDNTGATGGSETQGGNVEITETEFGTPSNMESEENAIDPTTLTDEDFMDQNADNILEATESEAGEVTPRWGMMGKSISRTISKAAGKVASFSTPVKALSILGVLFGGLSLGQFMSINQDDIFQSDDSAEFSSVVYGNTLGNKLLSSKLRDPKYLAYTIYAELRSSHVTAEYVEGEDDEGMKSSSVASSDDPTKLSQTWDNDELSYSAGNDAVNQENYYKKWSEDDDNKIWNEYTEEKEQTARPFKHEVVLGILSNMWGESEINDWSWEGWYVIPKYLDDDTGSATMDDLRMFTTHHSNWDVYYEALSSWYGGSGVSISESGYTYTKPLNESKLNLVIETDDTTEYKYPGVGLLAWTGKNAYKLQEFCNVMDYPHEADGDQQNDAMYSTDGQLSFMLHDNTGTFKIEVPNDLKGAKYVEEANEKIYKEALKNEQEFQSWKGKDGTGDASGNYSKDKLKEIREKWAEKIDGEVTEVEVPLVVWATYQTVNYKYRMFTYLNCNLAIQNSHDLYDLNYHQKADDGANKQDLYYRLEMDITTGDEEAGDGSTGDEKVKTISTVYSDTDIERDDNGKPVEYGEGESVNIGYTLKNGDPAVMGYKLVDFNPQEAYTDFYPLFADKSRDMLLSGSHPGSCGCPPASGEGHENDIYEYDDSCEDKEYRIGCTVDGSPKEEWAGHCSDIRLEVTVYDQFGRVLKSVENGKKLDAYDGFLNDDERDKSEEGTPEDKMPDDVEKDKSVHPVAKSPDEWEDTPPCPADEGEGDPTDKCQDLILEVGWTDEDLEIFWKDVDEKWKYIHDCARYHYMYGPPEIFQQCDEKAKTVAGETFQKTAKKLNDKYIGYLCCDARDGRIDMTEEGKWAYSEDGLWDDTWKLNRKHHDHPEASRYADWTEPEQTRVYSAMGEVAKIMAKQFVKGHQGMDPTGDMLGSHIRTADRWAHESHLFYHDPLEVGWNWRGNDALAEGLCEIYTKDQEKPEFFPTDDDGSGAGGGAGGSGSSSAPDTWEHVSNWRLSYMLDDYFYHSDNAYLETTWPDDVAVALSYAKNFDDVGADIMSLALDADGKYLKYFCTSAYIAVKDIVSPEDINVAYSSCDRGLSTIARASGQDDYFPLKIQDDEGAGIEGKDLLGQMNYCLKWSKVVQDGIRWRHVYEDGRDFQGYVYDENGMPQSSGEGADKEYEKTKPFAPDGGELKDTKEFKAESDDEKDELFALLKPGDIFIKDGDEGVRHVGMFVGQRAAMKKWPKLFDYDNVNEDPSRTGKWGVVDASHMSPDEVKAEGDTDAARGLRWDYDGSRFADGTYYVYRAATQNYNSSRKKWAVESYHNHIAAMPKGDVKTGDYYDQIAADKYQVY